MTNHKINRNENIMRTAVSWNLFDTDIGFIRTFQLKSTLVSSLTKSFPKIRI